MACRIYRTTLDLPPARDLCHFTSDFRPDSQDRGGLATGKPRRKRCAACNAVYPLALPACPMCWPKGVA
jgi:hypothetical protein